MKRLVGGDYLLDLSSIEIEESVDGTTKTNITDSDVLEQLTNLKKYIKNPEMAKPVWVKLVNGENDELVIARGTFAVVDTGEFEICVQLDGYKLVIFIEFTQATLSDNTPIDDWYIDTNDAKYLFTSDVQNINAITSSGDLTSVKADEIIENMTGYSVELIDNTGYTFEPIYAGAVKNGNKLTFVFAWNYTKTEDATNPNPYVIKFNIPSDIASKLYPTLVSGNPVLDIKTLYGFSDLASSVAIGSWAEKGTNQVLLQLYTNSMVQDTKYYVRYEVTFLLSDNLIPEQAGE